MTWQTSEGDRTLAGNEATVVRETLAYMIDLISDNITHSDEPPLWDFGVALFDEATPTQQLMIAKSVAEHLLTKTDETLELTAVNEAAVYAIFRTLARLIEIEVDIEIDRSDDDAWKCFWRRLALAAHQEYRSDAAFDHWDGPSENSWTPQSAESRNLEQWESVTESLADRILWDRDFEMAGSVLDVEPAQAALLKQVMGIETNYYCDVAPDLKDDEIAAVLRSVRQLTHSKPR
ncbi:MAG: hypothetical protein HKN47_07885 [Pirellulaceae bacterium]|nr:hypothetical protein [Pirellulaceae bacterium]